MKRSPPKNVASLYGKEKVEKAFLYSIDKLWFSIVASCFGQVVENLFFWYYGVKYFWDLSERITSNGSEIKVSLLFTVLYGTFSMLLQIPFSIYSTFYIERKHGFNKQTGRIFALDQLKVWLLSLVIGLPILALLIKVIQLTGKYFFITAWLLSVAFQLFMILIYPSFIQPLFNKFVLLENGELKEKIEKLAQSLGFPLKEIFVVDGSTRSSHSNAYFFGLFKSKRIVLYDTLLKQASVDQICAIMGHELGHWAKSHMLKRLVLAQVQLFGVFFAFSFFNSNQKFFVAYGFTDSMPIIIGLMLIQSLLSPLFVLFSFLANYVSRVHEFEADKFSVDLGMGKDLKDGLISLHSENLSNPDTDPLYCIAHYSHPPLFDRLDAIDQALKKKK